MLYAKKQTTKVKKKNRLSSLQILQKEFNLDSKNKANKKKKSKSSTLAAIWIFFVQAGICLLYPFVVIPYYMKSSTNIKLFISLILHPICYEVTDAMVRSDKTFTRKTKKMIEKAKKDEEILKYMQQVAFENNIFSFGFDVAMAFLRRFLLLNMKNKTAQVVAVIATGLEEALARAWMPQIDAFFRKITGKEPLQGVSLKVQNIVWMVNANQAMIAEIIAIFVSSITYILMQHDTRCNVPFTKKNCYSWINSRLPQCFVFIQ